MKATDSYEGEGMGSLLKGGIASLGGYRLRMGLFGRDGLIEPARVERLLPSLSVSCASKPLSHGSKQQMIGVRLRRKWLPHCCEQGTKGRPGLELGLRNEEAVAIYQ